MSAEDGKIAAYNELTQAEFRDRINSPEFSQAVDQSLPAAAASPQPCENSRYRYVGMILNRYGSYPDTGQALLLVSQIGYIFLAGPDGCDCGSFTICGVEVSVSCRKSGNTISVNCEDCDAAELKSIAIEILRQIFEPYYDMEQKEELVGRFTIKINGAADSSGANLMAQLGRYEQARESPGVRGKDRT